MQLCFFFKDIFIMTSMLTKYICVGWIFIGFQFYLIPLLDAIFIICIPRGKVPIYGSLARSEDKNLKDDFHTFYMVH